MCQDRFRVKQKEATRLSRRGGAKFENSLLMILFLFSSDVAQRTRASELLLLIDKNHQEKEFSMGRKNDFLFFVSFYMRRKVRRWGIK